MDGRKLEEGGSGLGLGWDGMGWDGFDAAAAATRSRERKLRLSWWEGLDSPGSRQRNVLCCSGSSEGEQTQETQALDRAAATQRLVD
jgi:hypothetical protein